MYDLLNVRILRRASGRAGIYVALMIGVLSTGFFWTWITPAQASVSLDERVSVSYSSVRFNRRTRTFDRVATVTNNSEAPIFAPLLLVIRNIDPATVTLENAAGIMADGASFVELPLERGELLPNKKVRTLLRFNNPQALVPKKFNQRAGKAGRSDSRARGHLKKKALKRKRFTFDDEVVGTLVTLSTPGSAPFALSVDSQTDVRFMVRLFSTEPEFPSAVTLRRLDVAETFILNDGGEDGDGSANDSVFSTTVTIDTSDKLEQECLSFQAETKVNQALVTSPVFDLCITGFPTEVSPTNLALENQIDFADIGDPALAVANELIVEFNDNTTEVRIAEIVAEINGVVVGTVLPAGIYQVRFDSQLSPQEMLDELTVLRDLPEIKAAYPNLIAFAAADPDDSLFKGSGTTRGQDGLKKTNAADAWDFAKGSNISIAVLDSGVDSGHEDLKFKPNNTEQEADVHGHGTRVVGIIGALTNNEIGIAGAVGDDSTPRNINVYQTLDSNNSAKAADMVEDIINARNKMPKIMNLSFGCNWDPTSQIYGKGVSPLCKQIKETTDAGIMVVAAAGNFSSNSCSSGDRVYPAGCNVNTGLDTSSRVTKKQRLIVVANSMNNDKLNKDSYFGEWVDVAAPGTEILSTLKGNKYGRDTGTSYSAPFVTAAVAVLLSRYPDKLDKIEKALKDSAPATVTREEVEVGRIDVFEALKFLNDTPTINNQTFSVVDSAENKSLVGKVMAEDPEEDDLFFSIIEGNREDTFIINNMTGEINVNNNTILGSDSDPFTLTVQVKDGHRPNDSSFIFLGKKDSAEITINVLITKISDLVGDKDDFHAGDTEDIPFQSERVKGILALIEAAPGQGPGANLDVGGSDRPVGFTHSFTLPEGAEIRSATITILLRGNSFLVHNDAIIYDQSEPADVSVGFLPLIALRDLLGREPESGEILELKIDLAKVPVRTVDTVEGPGGHWSEESGKFRDLRPLLEDGQFDMVFGDDVTVDFSELKITFVTP